jgi:D-beta-D-heptose 7-phosphate kinase/D-beta-D-heptose 1-phosphate adenosyltransferase
MDTQQQKKFKVLLIGDSCIDEYHYGLVERLSPEAPVPIFKLQNKVSMPGMASNVRENLNKLDINVLFISSDKSLKIRLVDIKSKQHIVRIDDDKIIDNPLEFEAIDNTLLEVDAIVISDYNKGLVSYELVEQLRKTYNGPIFIDTKKKDLSKFMGCIIKINEQEYNNATSYNDTMIVTMGDKGALLKTRNLEKQFPVDNSEVVDVSGCGDTFLASLVYKYLETNNIETAIEFANIAAGITVRHMGVYAPKLEEIQ